MEVNVKAEEIITSGPEVEFDPGTASDRAFRESAALVPGGDDAAVRSVDRAAALLVSLGDADGAASVTDLSPRARPAQVHREPTPLYVGAPRPCGAGS